MPANGTYLVCLTIATLALAAFPDSGGEAACVRCPPDFRDGDGAGLRNAARQSLEVHSDWLRRRSRIHRGGARAGSHDRPLSGIFRRGTRAGRLAARKVRHRTRRVGHARSRLPGGTADLLRGRLHHPGAAGLEPRARNQALAPLLWPADGGGADHDSFAGAAASRSRRPPRNCSAATWAARSSTAPHSPSPWRSLPACCTAPGSRGACTSPYPTSPN